MSKTLKISYEFEDGKKYIGEYYETEDGYVWHGKGRMTYAGIDKGTIYWGNWEDGYYHGKGTLIHPDGEKYVGNFQYGMPKGRGRSTYVDGSKYVGEHSEGYRHGKVVCNLV